MWSSIYFPYLPSLAWLIPGAFLLIALIVLLYLRTRPPIQSVRRNVLLAIRLIVIALIIFCICDPILRIFKSEKFQSLVAVVVEWLVGPTLISSLRNCSKIIFF